MPPAVVLDACVLVPHPLFDTLLRLADAELLVPLWSSEILHEVERTLTGKRGLSIAAARRRIGHMNRAFPAALVEGHEHLVASMTNDPKDRHVLAAAVHAGAQQIVTANLRDFAEPDLRGHGIEAIHPDHFLLDQLEADESTVLRCLAEQRGDYSAPPQDAAEFFRTFLATVPQFALAAQALSGRAEP